MALDFVTLQVGKRRDRVQVTGSDVVAVACSFGFVNDIGVPKSTGYLCPRRPRTLPRNGRLLLRFRVMK
jgi:hypothetical protein